MVGQKKNQQKEEGEQTTTTPTTMPKNKKNYIQFRWHFSAEENPKTYE